MKRKNYLPSELISQINKDSQLTWENLIILVCAIFIACIGLNLNSTATVIGAMLLSPLMGPLLAIGSGVALYQSKLFKRGIGALIVEAGISIITSTLYFAFSPLSYASQEIIARTSPTIWDVLVAFFGGVAGIIGARKSGATNVVAGVAIATALMPPLCTVGYAVAAHNLQYFLGAGYLFVINAVFIILTSFLGVKVMKLLHDNGSLKTDLRQLTFRKVLVLIALVILIIPSFWSAKQLVNKSVVEANVQHFIADKLTTTEIIKQQVDMEKHTINLTVTGSQLTTSRLKELKQQLPSYHLKGYSLNIIHIASIDTVSEKQLNNRVTNIVNQQQKKIAEKQEKELAKQEKRNQQIKKLSPEIASVMAVNDQDKQKQVVLIELKSKLEKDEKTKIEKKIMDRYPEIHKVEFVQKDD